METALRYHEGKTRFALIPLDCHIWEAEGFAYGASKYEMDNWRKGQKISTQMDSLLRHLEAFYYRGEDVDPESGVHHLGLAQCNLAMMCGTVMNHPELDDRYRKPEEPKPVANTAKICDEYKPKTGCSGIACEQCLFKDNWNGCRPINSDVRYDGEPQLI
jgi:hypothetical protein